MGGTGGQYRAPRQPRKRLTAIGVSVLLKGPKVWSTWSKDTVGVQGLGNELVETEMRRRPSTAGKTTVEPVLGTVGSIGGCSAVSASTAGQHVARQSCTTRRTRQLRR